MTVDHVECARRVITTIQYITVASVRVDHLAAYRPWNSPVYAAFDPEYTFCWVSHIDSQHSRNIRCNPHVFLAIYDSTIPEGTSAGSGVYIQARARELTDHAMITAAHRLIAGRVGKPPQPAECFLGERPKRIYQAIPERVWVSDIQDQDGSRIDVRVDVDLTALRMLT